MYEGSLCVCCMSTDDLVDLFGTQRTHISENYAKLMGACLNMQVSEDNGHDSICTNCAAKLKDCVNFKRQVLRSLSIISSIELSELITTEECQILGLMKKEEPVSAPSLESTQNYNLYLELEVTTLDEEENVSPNTANRSKIEETPKTDINCSKINETLSKKEFKEQKPAVDVKSKRPVGRPRLRPPNVMPYRIGKDEMTCRECGEEFPCNITLKVHYNTHFGRYSCGTCSKGFMTHSSLKKHETSHLQGPFTCENCGQQFRSINTLYSHKRYKHASSLPFRCRECGAGFSTLQRRLQHLAEVHQWAPRRHACRYCQKKFSHAGERAKHIANHHEIKFVECVVCGARCRRGGLRAHMRRHAGDDAREACGKTAERRFCCKLCSKDFTQKTTLKSHIRSHIRRGEYNGELDYLIVDRRDPKAKNTGLLSEDETEQHLDESLLSDNGPDDELRQADDPEELFIRDSDIEILDESIIDLLSDIGFSDLDI